MALTEKERKRIAEEEAYRAQLREETQYRQQVRTGKLTKKKGVGIILGILLAVASLPVLLAITLLAINPAKQFEKAENARIANITPFPANELANKTEEQIKTNYSTLYSNYNESGLTPSQKVKVTSFDIEKANVQIDYVAVTSTPLYIGYSFTKPFSENEAWAITGVQKPTVLATERKGIKNTTVYTWEDITEIEPYRMIAAVYNAQGDVEKIGFSMEDLDTAKSSNSLYYKP